MKFTDGYWMLRGRAARAARTGARAPTAAIEPVPPTIARTLTRGIAVGAVK